jgi:hypothetical protein
MFGKLGPKIRKEVTALTLQIGSRISFITERSVAVKK